MAQSEGVHPTRNELGLVSLHGAMLGRWIWTRVEPFLAAPALAVDLPGRGARPADVTKITLGDDQVRKIVERYIDAWERGDVTALAAMLAEDATFAMPPYPMWWQGRDIIAAFASEPVHRYLPAHSNGQPANAAYRWDPSKRIYAADALEVLTLVGPEVKAMTAFMTPDVFRHFGLPDQLEGEPP